jgi:hypothetical protein
MRIIEDISEGDATTLGWTYVFQSKDSAYIKIGKTNKSLKYRLNRVRNLANYNQYDLSFFFAIENDKYEKILHDAFSVYRARYSWSPNYMNQFGAGASELKAKVKNFIKSRKHSELPIPHINLVELKRLRNSPPLSKGEPRNFDHINTLEDALAEDGFLDHIRHTRLELFKFERILDRNEIFNLILQKIEN